MNNNVQKITVNQSLNKVIVKIIKNIAINRIKAEEGTYVVDKKNY